MRILKVRKESMGSILNMSLDVKEGEGVEVLDSQVVQEN